MQNQEQEPEDTTSIWQPSYLRNTFKALSLQYKQLFLWVLKLRAFSEYNIFLYII